MAPATQAAATELATGSEGEPEAQWRPGWEQRSEGAKARRIAKKQQRRQDKAIMTEEESGHLEGSMDGLRRA